MRPAADKQVCAKLIATVEECIRDAKAAGLDDAAAIFEIARLNLTLRSHAITQEELELLLFLFECERCLSAEDGASMDGVAEGAPEA